jgi:acetamidase/formamidase
MAIHSIEPERRTLHGHFSRDLPPCLTIDSGDTVVFRTLDARWTVGLSASGKWDTNAPQFSPIDPQLDSGHALCGPVAIRGAKPGMTLEIQIKDIVPGDWGWTFAGGWPHDVNRRLNLIDSPTLLSWSIDSEAMTATNQHGHRVQLRPFMGVMGMPTDEPGILSTAPPRATGGNLDCKELVAGTRLFLPVAVESGLFSVGDGHARQGDGESSVTAIECPMECVELTFILHDDMPLTTPRAETAEGWLSLGVHEDLQEATYLALDDMMMLIQEKYSVSRADALALASIVADLRITQIVNGVRGVHAVLPHDAITLPGKTLIQ